MVFRKRNQFIYTNKVFNKEKWRTHLVFKAKRKRLPEATLPSKKLHSFYEIKNWKNVVKADQIFILFYVITKWLLRLFF